MVHNALYFLVLLLLNITLNLVYVPSGICLATVLGLILFTIQKQYYTATASSQVAEGPFQYSLEGGLLGSVAALVEWPRCPDTLLVPGPSCCFWA